MWIIFEIKDQNVNSCESAKILLRRLKKLEALSHLAKPFQWPRSLAEALQSINLSSQFCSNTQLCRSTQANSPL